MKNHMKIWKCKIGRIDDPAVPDGADIPMREAVARAYKEITGKDAGFIFSGWGAELDKIELEVVADHKM